MLFTAGSVEEMRGWKKYGIWLNEWIDQIVI